MVGALMLLAQIKAIAIQNENVATTYAHRITDPVDFRCVYVLRDTPASQQTRDTLYQANWACNVAFSVGWPVCIGQNSRKIRHNIARRDRAQAKFWICSRKGFQVWQEGCLCCRTIQIEEQGGSSETARTEHGDKRSYTDTASHPESRSGSLFGKQVTKRAVNSRGSPCFD